GRWPWSSSSRWRCASASRCRAPSSGPRTRSSTMVQAWDVAQGHGLPAHYPPGFPLLLAPLTLLGAHAFMLVARFAPPLFGVAEALGLYVLLERRLGAWPALAGALVAALMPE